MKVLFTHSYFLRFDAKQWKLQQPYAPLATIQASSFLRKKNFTVDLWDSMFEENPLAIEEKIKSFAADVLAIYDDGFNYLTKMCLTNMRDAAVQMIAVAKKNNCIVIVSSSDSTDHSEKYLQAGADFIIAGEGEVTLLELMEKIKVNETNFTSVDGLKYFDGEKLIITQKRNVLKELDSLPMPAWDLIDLHTYKRAWQKSSGYFSINLNTTRGCPFKCNWCAKPIYGNRYNSRSPQHVVNEIKFLIHHAGINHIWFCDDIFGLKPGWINEFADLLEKEKIKIPFKIQCRVDLLLQEENIKALARAGCDTVWVGAESGSQKILDAMDKGTTVGQIYEATRLLKKHNIKPAFFLQFGYLGETMEDINLTIEMLNDLLPDDIGISVSYPLPGTKFYEKVKGDLKVKANWTDSDELQLMFNNTYSAEFYKQLHRYVHKNYRKHQGLNYLQNIFRSNFIGGRRRLKRIASTAYFIPASFIEKKKLDALLAKQ